MYNGEWVTSASADEVAAKFASWDPEIPGLLKVSHQFPFSIFMALMQHITSTCKTPFSGLYIGSATSLHM